ncbi:MAG: hypothetical protein R3B54_15920 [Bdellovibrionota bacterium]
MARVDKHVAIEKAVDGVVAARKTIDHVQQAKRLQQPEMKRKRLAQDAKELNVGAKVFVEEALHCLECCVWFTVRNFSIGRKTATKGYLFAVPLKKKASQYSIGGSTDL